MQCSTDSSFGGAQAECAAIGARLCTVYELASDVTRGTGCELDRALVWTSDTTTACGAGGTAYPGSTKDQSGAQCPMTAGTRCCSDSQLPAPTPAYDGFTALGPGGCRTATGKKPSAVLDQSESSRFACAAQCFNDPECVAFDFKASSGNSGACILISEAIRAASQARKGGAECFVKDAAFFCANASPGASCDDGDVDTINDVCPAIFGQPCSGVAPTGIVNQPLFGTGGPVELVTGITLELEGGGGCSAFNQADFDSARDSYYNFLVTRGGLTGPNIRGIGSSCPNDDGNTVLFADPARRGRRQSEDSITLVAWIGAEVDAAGQNTAVAALNSAPGVVTATTSVGTAGSTASAATGVSTPTDLSTPTDVPVIGNPGSGSGSQQLQHTVRLRRAVDTRPKSLKRRDAPRAASAAQPAAQPGPGGLAGAAVGFVGGIVVMAVAIAVTGRRGATAV